MPRPPRADVAGHLYHALYRGNARQPIFHKNEDYEAFEDAHELDSAEPATPTGADPRVTAQHIPFRKTHILLAQHKAFAASGPMLENLTPLPQ